MSVLLFYQQIEYPPVWLGVVSLCLIVCLIWLVCKGRILSLFRSLVTVDQIKVLMVLSSVLGFIIGISWVFWQTFFMPIVPARALNQSVCVTETIVELPNQSLSTNRVRVKYRMKLDEIAQHSSSLMQLSAKQLPVSYNFRPKPIVSINWYVSRHELSNKTILPKLGERWRFRVKLKANHSTINPSGFDYEAWLLQQGIAATGYVKAFTRAEKRQQTEPVLVMQKISSPSFLSLFTWRNWLANRLNQVFEPSTFLPFYKALTFGDKSAISVEDWTLLRNTGTIHLMVISGLHMGIIAFLGFWSFKRIWRWGGYRQMMLNLPEFAALGGLLFATLYLMVSGFSIPTQRAWLMVVSVLVFVLVKRKFQPWSALALAALVVVFLDTTAVLSFGFWLSFIAVTLIFLALQGRARRQIKQLEASSKSKVIPEKPKAYQVWLNHFKTLLWIQWVLTLGLAPFLVWAFHSLPAYSFIANLIAVPFISFVGLPWLFLSSVVGLFSVETGQWMIAVLDVFWAPFWQFLQWVNQLPFNTVAFSERSIFWLLAVYTLLFWGLKLKKPLYQHTVLLLVFIWIMSISFNFFNHIQRPLLNQAKLTVLDVGQAQAIVIETQNHLVLYDLGGKWGANMDGTKLAIQPYLTAHAWSKVDLLIVSHSDMDHAGGLSRLLKNFSVTEAVSGQPEVLNQRIQMDGQKGNRFSLCLAGQSWLLDGVRFDILSPNKKWMDTILTSDNDLSCVLKVTTEGGGILITGDLSQKGEALLLQAYDANDLNAAILIAGHHGSKSSSSLAWLQTVAPEHIVFSTGYLNRFHFPSSAVLQRIATMNQRERVSTENTPFIQTPFVQWWNTACSGALVFETSSKSIKLPLESRKTRRKWYHHRCLESQQGQLFQ